MEGTSVCRLGVPRREFEMERIGEYNIVRTSRHCKHLGGGSSEKCKILMGLSIAHIKHS